jgi:hypothetical protein
MSGLKAYLRWGMLAVWLLICLPLGTEFVIELARERGFFERPASKLGALMNSPALHIIFWLITGLLIGLWLDWLLSKGRHHFLRANKDALSDEIDGASRHTTELPDVLLPHDAEKFRNLEIIIDQVFTRTAVLLDGKYYRNCQFHEVTFIHNGGQFRISHSIIADHRLRSEVPGITRALDALCRLNIFPSFQISDLVMRVGNQPDFKPEAGDHSPQLPQGTGAEKQP